MPNSPKAILSHLRHSRSITEKEYEKLYKAIERPKGKWIDYSDEGYIECPFCHSATNCEGNIEELHYCFSCGAEMRGESNEK